MIEQLESLQALLRELKDKSVAGILAEWGLGPGLLGAGEVPSSAELVRRAGPLAGYAEVAQLAWKGPGGAREGGAE